MLADLPNRSALSTTAVKLSATIAPAPGTVIRRRAGSDPLARSRRSLSIAATAEHSVAWTVMKPQADHAEDRFAAGGLRQLIAERLPEPALVNAGHPDASGLQDTTDMAFGIIAQTEQPVAGPDQRPEPVRIKAADMDRHDPAGPCELGQPLGIGGIGFVQPRGQDLVGTPRIHAGHGQAQIAQRSLQPDRQLAAFVNGEDRCDPLPCEKPCHGGRIAGNGLPGLDGPGFADDTDRDFLEGYVEPGIVLHGLSPSGGFHVWLRISDLARHRGATAAITPCPGAAGGAVVAGSCRCNAMESIVRRGRHWKGGGRLLPAGLRRHAHGRLAQGECGAAAVRRARCPKG